jgi:hypothetical protein
VNNQDLNIDESRIETFGSDGTANWKAIAEELDV